jgi:hypothetical protein
MLAVRAKTPDERSRTDTTSEEFSTRRVPAGGPGEIPASHSRRFTETLYKSPPSKLALNLQYSWRHSRWQAASFVGLRRSQRWRRCRTLEIAPRPLASARFTRRTSVACAERRRSMSECRRGSHLIAIFWSVHQGWTRLKLRTGWIRFRRSRRLRRAEIVRRVLRSARWRSELAALPDWLAIRTHFTKMRTHRARARC